MSRDSDVYDAMRTLLEQTDAFTAVGWSGEGIEDGPRSADLARLAVLTHVSADELDDVDPVEIVRKVSFKLEITAREEDPAERAKTLDRLQAAARKAVNGKSLAGLTLPALTMLRRETLGPVKHPNQTLTLTGEFAYLISGYDGHDDDE